MMRGDERLEAFWGGNGGRAGGLGVKEYNRELGEVGGSGHWSSILQSLGCDLSLGLGGGVSQTQKLYVPSIDGHFLVAPL